LEPVLFDDPPGPPFPLVLTTAPLAPLFEVEMLVAFVAFPPVFY
jgi:hypothetical protein